MNMPALMLRGPTAAEDERFMALALALGRRALGNCWPNPGVGAVVVRNSPAGPIIVGRGWTQPGGRPHAETEALRRAGPAARGATIYTTLEPCSHHGKTPPCVGAITDAGIVRVVSALEDPNLKVAGRGHALLRQRGIAVDLGTGAEAARRDHAGHIRRIREGRPQVTLKLALSSDGKVAAAGRKPVQITGEMARAHVHRMRAMNDAILVGIGTVLADDPALTCRLPGMLERSPNRIVLDSGLRTPLDGQLVRTAHDVPLWIFSSVEAPAEREAALRERGAEVFRIDAHAGRLDLDAVVRLLATLGITRLMVEGGPTIAAAFMHADLVDEAVLIRAPRPIGEDGLEALEGLPLANLTGGRVWRRISADSLGEDRIETFERA